MNDFKILTATLSKELKGIVKALEVIQSSKGLSPDQFSAFVSIVLTTFKEGFKGDPFRYEDLTPSQKAEILPRKGVDFFSEKDIEDMVNAVHALIKVPVAGKDFYTAEDKQKFLTDVVKACAKQIKELQEKSAYNNREERKSMIEEIKTYFSVFYITEKSLNKILKGFNFVKALGTTDFAAIARGLETLKGRERLDASAIKNLPIPVTNVISSITTSGGTSASVAIEKLTPTTSGNNVTLDLTALAHSWSVIIAVFKDGQLVDPASANNGWSRAVNTITVLNTDTTAVFMVEYAY